MRSDSVDGDSKNSAPVVRAPSVALSSELSRVDNDSLDYGLRWEHESEPGERNVLRWGFEAVGRPGVDADEVQEDLAGGLLAPVTGHRGHTVEAIPISELREALAERSGVD